MKFCQYFIVSICTLCLVLTDFNAQANELHITAETGEACKSTPRLFQKLDAPKPNIASCVTVKPYDGAFKLKCNADPNLPSNLTLTWLKDSVVVPTNDRITTYESDKHHVLEFNPIIPEDMGTYQCREVKKIADPANITPERIAGIDVAVYPYVKQAHKDFTVVEENPINLTCTVLSHVNTTVIWTVKTPGTNNTELNFTVSEGRIILDQINDTKNAILYIKSANLSLDRGHYHCKAYSDVGFSSTGASFMVRLKSKYASLWPFLGICAEVIVLCAIILIYEKKRDKSEMEESDTDQGPETKSSPDHGQDGVRYRK